MKSRFIRILRPVLCVLLAVLTGCHPTQPFYLREDGDLSHYINKATKVEYADVREEPLADAQQSRRPITLSNPEFDSLWDLPLQECVHIALANTKVVRGGSSPRIQQGQIIPGTQEGVLVDQALAFTTIYNPAIVESGVGSLSGTGISPGDGNVGVEAALAQFDTQLRILGSQGNNTIFNRSDRPRNTVSQFFPTNVQTDNGGLAASLTKRTATGTTFSATSQTDSQAGNQQGSIQPLFGFWSQSLETRFDQPLLRGRGEQVNRLPIVIARINSDVNLATLEDQLQKMVANIEIRYWDLHNAYRTLETAKTGRDTTLTTWRTVYERFTQGVEPAQAEAQAREQYFAFRATVESSLRDLHNIENELRLLMGISASDGRLIRPIDEPTLALVEFNWDEVLAEALVRRPELRAQRWNLKRREMELIAARNQLLPRLDIGAFYRFVGVGDELIASQRRGVNFPTNGSTAWEVLSDGDFQEFGFSGIFEAPIGFRRELAGVRAAQLAIAREKAYLEDMELDLSHGLVRGVRNLDANYRLAQTHFNRWVAADREVKSAQAVYEQGVGQGRQPLDLLLDATRRRAQAQAAYYNAVSEYNKAIADVHMRKGSILEYDGVSFEEGPWTHKAYWDAMGRARERDAGTYVDYGWTRPRVISQGEKEFPSASQQGNPAPGRAEDFTPSEGEEATGNPAGRLPNDLGPTAEGPAPRTASAGGFEWGALGLTNSAAPTTTGTVAPVSYNAPPAAQHDPRSNQTNYSSPRTAPGGPRS